MELCIARVELQSWNICREAGLRYVDLIVPTEGERQVICRAVLARNCCANDGTVQVVLGKQLPGREHQCSARTARPLLRNVVASKLQCVIFKNAPAMVNAQK